MIQYEYSGLKQSKPPLVIDSNIAIWLMRMVYGEGGAHCSITKSSMLLWAIVNRWFLRPGSARYTTFVSMFRAFSQPINPRWMTGGDLALKWFKNDVSSKARLARRDLICKLDWTSIPWVIRQAVSSLAQGRLHYPSEAASLEFSRVSNWASLDSTPENFSWGVDVQGDWFFEDRELITGNVVVRNGASS